MVSRSYLKMKMAWCITDYAISIFEEIRCLFGLLNRRTAGFYQDYLDDAQVDQGGTLPVLDSQLHRVLPERRGQAAAAPRKDGRKIPRRGERFRSRRHGDGVIPERNRPSSLPLRVSISTPLDQPVPQARLLSV